MGLWAAWTHGPVGGMDSWACGRQSRRQASRPTYLMNALRPSFSLLTASGGPAQMHPRPKTHPWHVFLASTCCGFSIERGLEDVVKPSMFFLRLITFFSALSHVSCTWELTRKQHGSSRANLTSYAAMHSTFCVEAYTHSCGNMIWSHNPNPVISTCTFHICTHHTRFCMGVSNAHTITTQHTNTLAHTHKNTHSLLSTLIHSLLNTQRTHTSRPTDKHTQNTFKRVNTFTFRYALTTICMMCHNCDSQAFTKLSIQNGLTCFLRSMSCLKPIRSSSALATASFKCSTAV